MTHNSTYRILVVDDDDAMRMTTAELLRLSGYDVREAADGESGLRSFLEYDPYVCILDVMMPDMSGLQLLEKLNIHNSPVEAIMMTGHESLEDVQKAMELGAFGYVTKPLEYSDLEQKVKRAIAQVEQDDADRRHVANLESESSHRDKEVAALKDILEEKDVLLDRVLGSVAEGLLAVDGGWSIVFMNPAAENILAVTFADCVGKKLFDLAGEFAVLKNLGYDVAMAGQTGPTPEVVTVTRPGKNPRHFLVKISPFEDDAGRRVGTIINLVEQTARIEAERLRDFFLSIVAHELRTPVTILKTGLQLLKGHIGVGDAATDLLQDMVSTNNRLDTLVRKVISIVGLTDSNYRCTAREIDLRELVDKCARRLGESAADTGVSVLVHNRDPMHACVDEYAAEIAIFNVMENAVRFNRSGGSVDIDLGRTAGNVVTVSIADQGEGMAEDIRRHLFTFLYQGEDPLTRTHQGMGLGLYLTARAVSLMEGSVNVETVPHGGTVVTLEIPAYPAKTMEETNG